MNRQKSRLLAILVAILFSHCATSSIYAQSTATPKKITVRELFQLKYVGNSNNPERVTLLSWKANLIAVAYTEDVNLHIFDFSTKEITFEISSSSSWNSMVDVSWSPDGKFIAVASRLGGINIWNTSSIKNASMVLGGDTLHSITWNPNSEQLAVLGLEPRPSERVQATIHDIATGKLLVTLKMDTENWGQIAWSLDGRLIAAGDSGFDSIQIWDAATFKNVATIPNIGSPIAWNKDNKHIAGTRCPFKIYCTIEIWDVEKGQLSTSFKPEITGVNFGTIQWSPKGDLIAVSGEYKTQVFNPDTGELVAEIGTSTRIVAISPLSWSDDGTMIAVGDEDGIVHIWEIR